MDPGGGRSEDSGAVPDVNEGCQDVIIQRYVESYLQDVLPSKAKWLKDSVTSFDPSTNKLVTANGDSVSYDWLVIATGLQLR